MGIYTILGHLTGAMIDPLTWGLAILCRAVMRSIAWFWSVLAAPGIAVLYGISIMVTQRAGEPFGPNLETLVLTGVATLIWGFAVAGVMTLLAHSRRRT